MLHNPPWLVIGKLLETKLPCKSNNTQTKYTDA